MKNDAALNLSAARDISGEELILSYANKEASHIAMEYGVLPSIVRKDNTCARDWYVPIEVTNEIRIDEDDQVRQQAIEFCACRSSTGRNFILPLLL